MKLFKKILSAILSVGMIFSASLSTNVFADGGQNISVFSVSTVPSSLEECCLALDQLLSDRADIKEDVKANTIWKLHMGLGLWIRNHWIHPLPYDKIAKLLCDNGCSNPDDMSCIILEHYRNYLLTGESSVNVLELVVNHEFECLSRFDKSITKEEIQEKIKKEIEGRKPLHKTQNTWWCSIL